MIEIVLASSNAHKVKEINAIANAHGINFVKVKEGFDPVEDGETFEANSAIKAKAASVLMKTYALADDAGLCVDELDGRPGIYSARYAPTQAEKIAKLLDELKNIPDNKRTAHFVCSMTLTNANGDIVHTTKGICNGKIAHSPYGNGGFGYDPIFIVDSLNKTMAEFSLDEKNTLSHRAKALLPMIKWIKSNL